MAIEISDGFNFTLGEYLAELAIGAIGMAAVLIIGGIVYGGFCLCEWIEERRFRK